MVIAPLLPALETCLAVIGVRCDSLAVRIASPTALGILAGLNRIDDSSPQPIPYEIFKVIEDVFLEKRPYKGNTYTLVPRAANYLKARLIEMVQHDPQRTKLARHLLAQIEPCVFRSMLSGYSVRSCPPIPFQVVH